MTQAIFRLFVIALLALGAIRWSVSEAYVDPPTCSHGSMLYDTTSPGQTHGNLVQWTKDGSGIVFDSSLALYRTGVDGTWLQRIVDGLPPVPEVGLPLPGSRLTVAVSSDGSEIVYATCRYPTEKWFFFEIATSKLDGTEPRRLTPPKRDVPLNHFPVWSPDGTRIAYIRDQSSTEIRLYTMFADGSGRLPATYSGNMRVGYFPPAWSPDGQRLAFVVEEGYEHGRAIYTIGQYGLDPIRLSSALSGPSWSPDGRWIAFIGAHTDGPALYTIAADGSADARLIRLMPDGSDTWPPSWSPDGSEVLVDCIAICVVDVESGSIVAQSPLRLHGGSVGAWSPDGSRIAVLMTRQLPYPNGAVVLYTMARDATDVQVLVRGGLSLVAENSGWQDVSAGIASCSGGLVIPEPDRKSGLVSDCETLMRVRDTLAGKTVWRPFSERGVGGIMETHSSTVVLNWGPGTSIDQWTGVGVEEVCGPEPLLRAGGCEPVNSVYPDLRHGPFGFVSPPPRPLESRVTALDFSLPRGGVIPYGDAYSSGGTYSSEYLHGVIPPGIGDLRRLRTLNLAGIGYGINNLRGGIPPELGNLRDLRELDLARNGLAGGLPTELARLSRLETLNLGENDFEGAIPPELGRLRNLQYMNLQYNRLSGGVPPEFAGLAELKELRLSRNRLSGDIPPEMGGLTRLEKVLLGNNLITGLPAELADITGLRQLEISGNMLSCLPAELLYRDGLRLDSGQEPCAAGSYHFRVSELAGTGHVVGAVLDADAVSYSIVSGNEDGRFAIGETSGLISVDSALEADTTPSHVLGVESKDRSGRPGLVTVTISVLSRLEPCSTGVAVPDPEHNPGLVSDCANLLAGKHSIGSSDFYLGWNANTPITNWRGVTVGGSPPRVQGLNLTLENLVVIEGDQIPNRVHGHIPPEFGGLTDLRRLNIRWQDMSGEIPAELGNLPRLERIYLGGNQFTGCMPLALRDIEFKELASTGLPYCEQ